MGSVLLLGAASQSAKQQTVTENQIEQIADKEKTETKDDQTAKTKEDKIGRFEMAEDGTIFLDEIGNLSLSLQKKLLTVLQDLKVSRIGEGIERPINARMVFATNAPLKEWVAEGKFRQDLMYRINTLEIEIPPLRSRPSDIPEFVHFYFQSNHR